MSLRCEDLMLLFVINNSKIAKITWAFGHLKTEFEDRLKESFTRLFSDVL